MKEKDMSCNDEYQRSSGDAAKWLVAGFGMGLLVGGALGLLLAPKPGRETREQIKVIAGDMSTRAKTAAMGISEKAKTTATEVSKKAKDYSEKIKGGIDQIKETGEKFTAAAKDGFKRKMDELKTKTGNDECEETGEE